MGSRANEVDPVWWYIQFILGGNGAMSYTKWQSDPCIEDDKPADVSIVTIELPRRRSRGIRGLLLHRGLILLPGSR